MIKFLSILFVLNLTAHIATAAKPNIILLYMDDWAWNGTPVAMDDAMNNSMMPVLEMPNVSRLAREGMKFSNAYGSPQCSPARVCVQTGQSSPRNGYTVFMNALGQNYFNAKKSKGFPVVSCISDETIDPGAVTIPEALKALGYISAHIGKWHMRGSPADEGYAQHDGDTTNDAGNTIGKVKRLPKDLSDPKLMFSVTKRSLAFMETQAKAKQPFYLQISYYAMHAGSECLDETRQKYAKHPSVQAYYKKERKTAETISRNADPATWLGMGEDLDGRVGAVLDKIKSLGIEDNTYVIMVSDNGYRHKFYPGKKQPLHGHKWWLWQGGIRVPMIVKGPGIKPSTVFAANVVNYDFLPTFVEWAGGNPAALNDVDGISLAPYLAGRQPDTAFLNRNIYFHYPHYRTSMPHSAIISGNRKVMHFYERPDVPMLFDLKKDPGEVHNVATAHPEEHQKLFNAMITYLKEVDARIPKTNPDCDPKKYQEQKEYAVRKQWGPFTDSRALEGDEK